MSFHRWPLVIAALVYATAAWFGAGHHAEDEFQHVVLFAEHLRGHVDAASLPLDYHAHWRGMAQPLLCAGVFEACGAIGITDPFQLTLVLRLLTAALALWVTHGFIRSVSHLARPENGQAFVLLSWFLWFLPVLQIRCTGEAWSGLLFLRGLGLLMDQRQRSVWTIGAWFGAAVLFRPATALLPLGVVSWMVFVQQARPERIVQLAIGGGLVLACGAGIDSMAYGTFTSTLWNYGLAVITGEEAERFTTLPWYQYVLFTLKYAAVPIGTLLLVSFMALPLLRPRHVLVWTLLPFLVVHSALPVKEPRFLFPLAPLMPWLLIAAWEAIQERWPSLMQRDFWLRTLLPFAVVNMLAMAVGVGTPAGNGRIRLAQAIHERYGDEAVHIDQLGDWRQWIPPFYLAPHSTERFAEKIIADPKVNGPIHLVIAKAGLDLNRVDNLERVATATPAWADRLLGWYRLEDTYDPLVLYRVTTQHVGH